MAGTSIERKEDVGHRLEDVGQLKELSRKCQQTWLCIAIHDKGFTSDLTAYPGTDGSVQIIFNHMKISSDIRIV